MAKNNLRDNWTSLSVTTETRDKLHELKGRDRYDTVITDMGDIIKAFNQAFILLDNDSKRKLLADLKVSLSPKHFDLITNLLDKWK